LVDRPQVTVDFGQVLCFDHSRKRSGLGISDFRFGIGDFRFGISNLGVGAPVLELGANGSSIRAIVRMRLFSNPKSQIPNLKSQI
jgi:hypothetical protein